MHVLEIGNAIYAVYGSTSEAWGVNVTNRFDSAVAVSVRLALFALVYFGLALYCLLKGRFLYSLIARKPDDDETSFKFVPALAGLHRTRAAHAPLN